MPKIDLDKIEPRLGSGYPGKLGDEMGGRSSKRISDVAGITQFGANITILQPGAKSSLRHWHENQDEFMVVLQGVCTLVDDHGETELQLGDCAAFPAGDANGHCVVNTSDTEARFLIIGTRTATEVAWYSDIDMKVTVNDGVYDFTRKDGSPFSGDKE
ncbi:cupin domain-containing protein [Cognatishimia sp. WU-CL00825]|uniref:cupin domain-containing protein n=1 Tax=Cognatishimia sp. WU-CL00825 TaxID=3127658 RepID=UPI0031023D8F